MAVLVVETEEQPLAQRRATSVYERGPPRRWQRRRGRAAAPARSRAAEQANADHAPAQRAPARGTPLHSSASGRLGHGFLRRASQATSLATEYPPRRGGITSARRPRWRRPARQRIAAGRAVRLLVQLEPVSILAGVYSRLGRHSRRRERRCWPALPWLDVPPRSNPGKGVMAGKTTVELPITGMTCASCVARNEKVRSRKTPGRGVGRRQPRDRVGAGHLRRCRRSSIADLVRGRSEAAGTTSAPPR